MSVGRTSVGNVAPGTQRGYDSTLQACLDDEYGEDDHADAAKAEKGKDKGKKNGKKKKGKSD